MSANIFGDRFLERQGEGRSRAWHKLGLTFEGEAITASEAVRRARLDYRIDKLPLYTMADANLVAADMIEVPAMRALVREPVPDDPNPRVVGVVGKNYEFFNNHEIASAIDRLCQGFAVETVGALGQGETVFFALSMGGFEVQGDRIESYLLVTDQRDGAGGLTMAYTPIRVVCQNTLMMALGREDDLKATLPHSSLVKEEALEALTIFAQLKEIEARGKEALQEIARIPLSETDAERMIEAIYREPKMPGKVALALRADGAADAPLLMKRKEAWEREVIRVREFRAKVSDLYDRFNDEFPASARTGYALYNAVTEFEDHFRPGRSDKSRAESAAFGDRAATKRDAFRRIARDLK